MFVFHENIDRTRGYNGITGGSDNMSRSRCFVRGVLLKIR